MTSQRTPKPVFRILVVEDSKARVETFQSWLPPGVKMVVAPSAGRAIGIIKRDRGAVYGGIMLDHDLQQQALTIIDYTLSGKNVVESIVDYISPDVPILIHSMNPGGSVVMSERLDGEGFEVRVIPMEMLKKDTFLEWLQEARELWEDRQDG